MRRDELVIARAKRDVAVGRTIRLNVGKQAPLLLLGLANATGEVIVNRMDCNGTFHLFKFNLIIFPFIKYNPPNCVHQRAI